MGLRFKQGRQTRVLGQGLKRAEVTGFEVL